MMQGARKQQVACEATNASGATSHYFENIIFHPRDRARRGDASRTITAVFFPAVASRTTAGKRGYRRGQQVAHPGGAVQAPVYNRLGRNNAPLRARCRLRGASLRPRRIRLLPGMSRARTTVICAVPVSVHGFHDRFPSVCTVFWRTGGVKNLYGFQVGLEICKVHR